MSANDRFNGAAVLYFDKRAVIMQKSFIAHGNAHCFYVMSKRNGVWVKVSDDYLDVRDAAAALKSLRETYPDARLGGSCDPNGLRKPLI